MGENHFAPMPVAVYGMGLLMNAIAYTILVRTLIRAHGRDSEFAARIGGDMKGRISLALYRSRSDCRSSTRGFRWRSISASR